MWIITSLLRKARPKRNSLGKAPSHKREGLETQLELKLTGVILPAAIRTLLERYFEADMASSHEELARRIYTQDATFYLAEKPVAMTHSYNPIKLDRN